MNNDPRGTDFAKHRFTLRVLPRLPISGPVADTTRAPRVVDVAVFIVCVACALIAWWLP